MGNEPVAGDGESTQGQPVGSGAPEVFPEEPQVSLDDADYAGTLLRHAVDEAVSVASLSSAEDSDAPEKQWTVRSAPSALSATRRQNSVYRGYFDLIWERRGYLPAWPIGKFIKPGDVGIMVGGDFTALTSLAEMGIEISLSTPPGEETATISAGETSLNVEPEGGSGARGGAVEIEIRMHGENASLAHWEGGTRIVIDNLDSVDKAVVDRVKNGSWPKGGVVVTEALQARSGFFLISNEKDSLVRCEVSRADRDVLYDPVSALADPSLSISRRFGVAVSVVQRGEFTVGIRARRVRRSFMSGAASLALIDHWE